MIKIKSMSYEMIVICLLSALPIVDSVNGMLMYTNMPSIGTLYKIFVMGIMLIMIFSNGKGISKLFGIILATILYILMSISINYVISDCNIISMDYPIKLVFNIVLFYALIQNIKNKHISEEAIYKILNNNAYIIVICVIVPYLLGLGYTIYSGNIGYKGFYYSQNELNAVLIILLFFSLYKLYQKITILTIMQVLGIFICILLMSTKSSLIAGMLGFSVFVFEYIKKENARKKMILIGILSVGVVGVSGFVIGKITDMLTRQNSLHSIYNGSLLATITSGRIYTLEDAWGQFIEGDVYVLNALIGNGFFSKYLVEMDFFDVFFYLGIVGILFVVMFLAYVLLKGKRNLRNDKNIIRRVGFFVIIAFAFLTGHVLFMATSGWYFIIYCVFIIVYGNNSSNYALGNSDLVGRENI